ncbi:MAG: hypothetical protein VW080_03750 [Flavobacteriaceae bacterium]
MQFLRFLFSKKFLWQLVYMGAFNVAVFLFVSWGLKYYTNHSEYQNVPDLKGVPLVALPGVMSQENLRFEIIDSTKFVPSLPPLSVITHFPDANSQVKTNRKIYLTVNPSGYRKITVPNLIQITKRNAEAMIKSVGFELGEISYRDNIGKNMVLEIQYLGKKIEPGILLPKASKIDLVLGNGK